GDHLGVHGSPLSSTRATGHGNAPRRGDGPSGEPQDNISLLPDEVADACGAAYLDVPSVVRWGQTARSCQGLAHKLTEPTRGTSRKRRRLERLDGAKALCA
ncbi:unnamed protein product, partial [Amoebophrya sp. A25]